MLNNRYDIIVAGVGSMGAAACYELAQKGHRVLGIDQYNIPHDKGSHGGQSRIIRKAYFEHPDYVPLLQRAYEKWDMLERKTGEKVYYETGLLYIGPAGHPVMKGVREAARLHDIAINKASPEKFPQFNTDEKDELLLEPKAGFLLPGKAISLLAAQALQKGAVIHTGEKILEWKKEKACITVTTDKAVYECGKLIITAGAWTGKLLKELQVPLKVTRQIVMWVKPEKPEQFLPSHFPCWLIASENREGAYYGFPYLSGKEFGEPAGLKLALHFPFEETDADNVNREISKAETDELINGLKKYFPAVAAEVVAAKTCLYTNSPDENFVIDFLPGYDNDVTIACGFSGHGFKFATVVGEILTDMLIAGKTNLPVEFLSLRRF